MLPRLNINISVNMARLFLKNNLSSYYAKKYKMKRNVLSPSSSYPAPRAKIFIFVIVALQKLYIICGDIICLFLCFWIHQPPLYLLLPARSNSLATRSCEGWEMSPCLRSQVDLFSYSPSPPPRYPSRCTAPSELVGIQECGSSRM